MAHLLPSTHILINTLAASSDARRRASTLASALASAPGLEPPADLFIEDSLFTPLP